jgi:arylsulfatase A-like enzyme
VFCACVAIAGLLAWKEKPIPVKHQAANRPNIIIILTDDMGFSDVGCFGGNFVPTPNIDRIAKNGRKFTQYYSAAPICSPSRAGMLTGMNPARWNFLYLPG